MLILSHSTPEYYNIMASDSKLVSLSHWLVTHLSLNNTVLNSRISIQKLVDSTIFFYYYLKKKT